MIETVPLALARSVPPGENVTLPEIVNLKPGARLCETLLRSTKVTVVFDVLSSSVAPTPNFRPMSRPKFASSVALA